MLRRLIVVTALAAGMSIAAVMTLATPALAKGPTQARITGPGLARAIVVSGAGEPGQQGTLAVLAGQTGLFTVLFGADASVPSQTPVQLRSQPPKASLGPRYTVIYTVPGATPQPGEQFGRIRQDLYPGAAGGPAVYTPPGQDGFGQPLQVTGWLRASSQLTRTLAQLGVPSRSSTRAAPQSRPPAAHPAAVRQAGSPALAWLIASAAAIAAAALAGTGLLLRHRKPAAARDSEPSTSERTGGRVSLAAGSHHCQAVTRAWRRPG
jgi:hypothetical protein